MKKAILLVAAAIALTACGTHKKAESGASKTTVPVSVKKQAVSKAQKHTAEYIQQRIAAIYRCYDNPQYDEAGMRLMAPREDYDSIYCSTRYKALLKEALDLEEEDDILLDYDHWTSSQDDTNFTCKTVTVSNLTDSTAIAKVNEENVGKSYAVTLVLLFERNDWFVDDFLFNEDGSSEKEYFKRFIEEKRAQ
jgi:hypothetical protein